jgi:hypothetical protein
LLQKEFSEVETEKILQQLPIIFAVKNENKDTSLWCFIISENTRRFDNVLAISVVPDNKEVIDDFFLLSVNDFTRTNFLILSKNDPVETWFYPVSAIRAGSTCTNKL